MAKAPTFVHLHNHSQFSLLDGASRLDELVEQAVRFEMPALAITDHGNLFGAIPFFEAATARGIKPILGCETYVAPGSRADRTAPAGGRKPYHHLLLLVRNREGYANLMRLSTAGFLEGYYYRPRVDKELLASHAEGLIGTSTCLGGRSRSSSWRGRRRRPSTRRENSGRFSARRISISRSRTRGFRKSGQ